MSVDTLQRSLMEKAILMLSEILGHAQPSTTLNKYGHVLTEHKRDSMQKISGLYGKPDMKQDNECNIENVDISVNAIVTIRIMCNS